MKKILSDNKEDNIFFKIDIEGSEYEILSEIVYFQNQIIGLCIEFHSCNKNLHQIIKFIENFNLEVVHIHANNYNLPPPNEIPDVLEFTLLEIQALKEILKDFQMHWICLTNQKKVK